MKAKSGPIGPLAPANAPKNEAQRQLEEMPKILMCDHWLVIRLPDVTIKDDVLSLLGEVGVDVETKVTQWSVKSKSGLVIGFGCHQTMDTAFNGLVMGPDPSSALQTGRFRNTWGTEFCQIRRFQDGSLRNCVPISGPVKDAADFVLYKFLHLLKVHHPEVEVQVKKPLGAFDDLVKECSERKKMTKELRAKAQNFINIITGLASDELPIRKARARCSCLYGSHHPKQHFADSSVPHVDGELKEKSGCIPPKVSYLPVDVEITSKATLNPELFSRLSLYHLKQMNQALSLKGLSSALYGNILVVPFESTLFGIQCQATKTQQDLETNEITLQEMLQNVGSDHPCWWGALVVARRWINSQYLESDFPDQIADLLLAAAICGSPCGPGSSKLLQLDPPASVDAAFLRFLYILSFTNFETTMFFLLKDDCLDAGATAAIFNTRRHTLPTVCVSTPRDDQPCCHSRKLNGKQLKRVVNAARHSLFNILKKTPPTFNEVFTVPSTQYDLTVALKPFKSDPKTLSTMTGLPVLSFDAVQLLVEELTKAFETLATFHYNGSAHTIGVKVHDHTEIDVLIDDIKILGKGIVHDVCITKIEMQ